jgi:hypothetical protein
LPPGQSSANVKPMPEVGKVYPEKAGIQDWRCERGHLCEYFTPPLVCPVPGCGSRAFTHEVPAVAIAERRSWREERRQWH